MPYIIGTAGHIDHGKTSLIKALTGTDTDRLKEEKERGISIDLGFAHLDLPDGTSAGVVDVPGHERFIKNMLAGAHGIDLVLFTVAADDGVMPQTEEHFDIVHLLGVEMAIFVITKADLVSESRIREVEEEIDILTVGTNLEDSPKVAASSLTGQGLEELKQLVSQTLRAATQTTPTGYFRLPVDRAFVLQGHGVVVTGTALSGEVNVGEQVRCLPGNYLFRVRSLQVHGKAVHRHPAANPNTDRADLGLCRTAAGPDPDPSRFTPRLDAQLAERRDHPAFQRMDEAANVTPTLFKVENQVAHALAGAVISIAPASPRLEHWEAHRVE